MSESTPTPNAIATSENSLSPKFSSVPPTEQGDSLSTNGIRPAVRFTEDGFYLPKALMEDWGEKGEIVWGEPGNETVIPVGQSPAKAPFRFRDVTGTPEDGDRQIIGAGPAPDEKPPA